MYNGAVDLRHFVDGLQRHDDDDGGGGSGGGGEDDDGDEEEEEDDDDCSAGPDRHDLPRARRDSAEAAPSAARARRCRGIP